MKLLPSDWPFVPEAVMDCITLSQPPGKQRLYCIKKGKRQHLVSLLLLSGAIQTDDGWIRSTCIRDKDFECGLVSKKIIFLADINRHFQGVYFDGSEEDLCASTQRPNKEIEKANDEKSLQAETWLDELTEELS